jgi:hypothetical protein
MLPVKVCVVALGARRNVTWIMKMQRYLSHLFQQQFISFTHGLNGVARWRKVFHLALLSTVTSMHFLATAKY